MYVMKIDTDVYCFSNLISKSYFFKILISKQKSFKVIDLTNQEIWVTKFSERSERLINADYLKTSQDERSRYLRDQNIWDLRDEDIWEIKISERWRYLRDQDI